MERTVEIITRATTGSFDIKSGFVKFTVPFFIYLEQGKSFPSYLFIWV